MTLPINYHKSPTGKRSFSQPVELQENSPSIDRSIDDPHSPLREKLRSKGYIIVDEFNCAGLNTNSFLKLIGGINKGRPNAEDLKHAEEFAQNLKQNQQKK